MKGIPVPHYKPLQTTLNIAIKNLSANLVQSWSSLHDLEWFQSQVTHRDTPGWQKKLANGIFFTIRENFTICERTWKQRLRKELKGRYKEDKKEWVWSKNSAKKLGNVKAWMCWKGKRHWQAGRHGQVGKEKGEMGCVWSREEWKRGETLLGKFSRYYFHPPAQGTGHDSTWAPETPHPSHPGVPLIRLSPC